MIIPASQGKIKLLSDFVLWFRYRGHIPPCQKPFGVCFVGYAQTNSLLQSCGEEVKGQGFVRIQMEPLGPKLFVLSFF